MSAGLVGNPKMYREARWLLTGFYILLTLGGLTMIYPFWMMLTGSLSDDHDFRNRGLVPRYLFERDALFEKFLLKRYGDFRLLADIYEVEGVVRASDLKGRISAPTGQPPLQPLRDWRQFLSTKANRTYLRVADEADAESRYHDFLALRFDGAVVRGTKIAEWAELKPIERLNRTYHLAEQEMSFVPLPPWKLGRQLDDPDDPIYSDYQEFLLLLPPQSLLPVSGDFIWREWLKNQVSEGELPNREEFRPEGPTDPKAKELWERFLSTTWPESLTKGNELICAESEWRDFLSAKYGSDTALTSAWGDPTLKLNTAPLLYRTEDSALFVGNETSLRLEMMVANYRIVGKFLTQQSDAVFNTVILVILSILVALIINPLAAYGISRYQGRHGRLTLMFLVLTIAFPAEVAMIPSFLLLRDLNMLNTFAALVLPGAASGFSIFLLKGFFDGLPEELFESAKVDGAGDAQMFWHVALPLSAPILAVTALGSFTAAYSGYMWALLVCQDSKMWTLMVWLFQFQMNYSARPWLGMAAFVIASVPTLLVFVFCQRLILRGTIIPTEK